MENFPQYRAISGLSTLIKIQTKRFKHYKVASLKARSIPLKMLFRKYAEQSQESIKTMVAQLVDYGGPAYFPAEITEHSSFWTKVGGLFYTEEPGELLHKSEVIERYSLMIHRKSIELSFIPAATTKDVQDLIRNGEEAFATIRMLQKKGFTGIVVAYQGIPS